MGVRVSNAQNNAWAGSILSSVAIGSSSNLFNGLSSDGNWFSMTCDNCNVGTDTTFIAIDGNGDSTNVAPTLCLNGRVCTMYNNIPVPTSSPSRSPLPENYTPRTTCIRIVTGGENYDDGYLTLLINTGFGYYTLKPSQIYAKNSLVLDECYEGLLGVQVTNSLSNAWVGSIETSYHSTFNTYTYMKCTNNCEALPTGEAGYIAQRIVVDGNGDGIGDAECLNGNVCTLTSLADDMYQAEEYISSIPVVSTEIAGYNGLGYINMGAVQGSYVEFTNVNAYDGGDCRFTFRYNSGSSKSCSVSVNGIVIGVLDFPTTDLIPLEWYTESIDYTSCNQGTNNVVRVTAITADGGPNLDEMGLDPDVILVEATLVSLYVCFFSFEDSIV